jgi:hypothetical protein
MANPAAFLRPASLDPAAARAQCRRALAPERLSKKKFAEV